ncbi:MAG: hypothetical protein QXO70_05130 [Candidatus Pacearchaeota archaeon]
MENEKDKIRDYVVKLTGKVSVFEPLEIGEGYTIKIDGEITAVTDADNFDGTYIRYYKFSPIKAEVENKKGKIIKAKDTRSQSQKLRRLISWLWENNEKDPRDVETAYEETMNIIINEADWFYQKGLIKKDKN